MKRCLALFAVTALLAGCATERGPAAPVVDALAGPVPTTLKGYLTADALDGKTILPPPPAADSPQGRADQAFYDETRALKDTPRWKLAIQDNDLWGGGALKRFSCALDVELSETGTPVAWKLLHRIELDVRTIGTPPKDYFNRRRPALGNDKPICVPRESWMQTNASYPSGHSMTAWAWALILSEASPSKADALLRLGRESGESRAICGVHYPSDVEAGRTLGAAMVSRLHADAAFSADLVALKQEIAASKAKPTDCGG